MHHRWSRLRHHRQLWHLSKMAVRIRLNRRHQLHQHLNLIPPQLQLLSNQAHLHLPIHRIYPLVLIVPMQPSQHQLKPPLLLWLRLPCPCRGPKEQLSLLPGRALLPRSRCCCLLFPRPPSPQHHLRLRTQTAALSRHHQQPRQWAVLRHREHQQPQIWRRNHKDRLKASHKPQQMVMSSSCGSVGCLTRLQLPVVRTNSSTSEVQRCVKCSISV